MCSPTEKYSRRLLKKATFSPAQPLCAKTRLVPGTAAASEGQAYPLGYVEGLNDARTPLADFFNSLLVSAGGRVAWSVALSGWGCRRSGWSFGGGLRSLFLF